MFEFDIGSYFKEYWDRLPPPIRLAVLLGLVLAALLWTLLESQPFRSIIVAAAWIAALLIGMIINRYTRIQNEKGFRKRIVDKAASKSALQHPVGLRANGGSLRIDEHFVEPGLIQTEDIAEITENWRSDNEIALPYQVLKDAGDRDDIDGIVIWGMAGSGKTILAKWLAYEIASPSHPLNWEFLMRQEPEPHHRTGLCLKVHSLLVRLGLDREDILKRFPVPIRVALEPESLALMEERTSDASVIVGLLANELKKESSELKKVSDDLVPWLQRGLVIPILDQFDELNPVDQGRLLKSLQSFVESYPGNRPFVLMTRNPALRFPEGIDTRKWHTTPFNERHILQFLRKYYRQPLAKPTKGLATDRAVSVWVAIGKAAEVNPRYWDYVMNPLLLTQILSSSTDRHGDAVIPKTRPKIMEEYVFKLVEPHIGEPQHHKRNAPLFGRFSSLPSLAYEGMQSHSYNLTPDDPSLIDEFEGSLILSNPFKRGYVCFGHHSLQVFFASLHLANEFLSSDSSSREDLLEKLMREHVAPANIASGSDPWPVNWRLVITQALGNLTAGLDPSWQEQGLEVSFDVIDWFLAKPDPSASLLGLRLLSAVTECEPSRLLGTATDKAVAAWEQVLSAIGPGFRQDLWEAGFVLGESMWGTLESLLFAGETHDYALRVLHYLRQERSAKLIAAYVDQTGSLSHTILEAISSHGIVAGRPILAAFQRARTSQRIEAAAALLRLLGSAGFSYEGARILGEIVSDETAPEMYKSAAFDCLAKWGPDGIPLLGYSLGRVSILSEPGFGPLGKRRNQLLRGGSRTAVRPGGVLSDGTRTSLEQALTTVIMDPAFIQLKVFAYLTSKDAERKSFSIRLIQRKLNGQTRDAADFVSIMKAHLKAYRPRSTRQRLLGWLEPRIDKESDRSITRLMNYLYATLSIRGGPRPELVTSLVEVCAGVDVTAPFIDQLVCMALQDHCLSTRNTAFSSLRQRSMLRSPRNPGVWANSVIEDNISSQKLRREIAQHPVISPLLRSDLRAK